MACFVCNLVWFKLGNSSFARLSPAAGKNQGYKASSDSSLVSVVWEEKADSTELTFGGNCAWTRRFKRSKCVSPIWKKGLEGWNSDAQGLESQ